MNPEKKVRGNTNLYPELIKIASIQERNAGKTDELLHKKSKNAQNKVIHDAVKLGSQDDVKSKLYIYI